MFSKVLNIQAKSLNLKIAPRPVVKTTLFVLGQTSPLFAADVFVFHPIKNLECLIGNFITHLDIFPTWLEFQELVRQDSSLGQRKTGDFLDDLGQAHVFTLMG